MVGMDIEQYDSASPQQYLHGLLQREPDYEVIDAFKSYLSVMASPPTGFDDFAVQVRSIHLENKCNQVYNKFPSNLIKFSSVKAFQIKFLQCS